MFEQYRKYLKEWMTLKGSKESFMKDTINQFFLESEREEGREKKIKFLFVRVPTKSKGSFSMTGQ